MTASAPGILCLGVRGEDAKYPFYAGELFPLIDGRLNKGGISSDGRMITMLSLGSLFNEQLMQHA